MVYSTNARDNGYSMVDDRACVKLDNEDFFHPRYDVGQRFSKEGEGEEKFCTWNDC